MKRRRFFEAVTAALLAVTMITAGFLLAAPVMAQGKGGGNNKGGGGTVEPALLPPIEYQIRYFEAPGLYPNDMNNLGLYPNDMNNWGVCVGWYRTPDGVGHAWLFDPEQTSNQAIDLNDIGFKMPDGWEGCVISSAAGINDRGDIVGVIRSPENVRHGFVVDMVALELTILPDGQDWTRNSARLINENGDIKGFFGKIDGTYGFYLYNPGLYNDEDRDPEPEEVFVGVNIQMELTNKLGDRPALAAGRTSDGLAFIYPKGGPLLFPYDETGPDKVCINDFGTLAGQVQIKRRETHLFRDDGLLQVFADSKDKSTARSINNANIILCHGSSGNFLHNDDWGFVNLNDLVTGTDEEMAEWTGYQNNMRTINDNGPLGFGQILGWKNFSDGVWRGFILTPVEKTR